MTSLGPGGLVSFPQHNISKIHPCCRREEFYAFLLQRSRLLWGAPQSVCPSTFTANSGRLHLPQVAFASSPPHEPTLPRVPVTGMIPIILVVWMIPIDSCPGLSLTGPSFHSQGCPGLDYPSQGPAGDQTHWEVLSPQAGHPPASCSHSSPGSLLLLDRLGGPGPPDFPVLSHQVVPLRPKALNFILVLVTPNYLIYFTGV